MFNEVLSFYSPRRHRRSPPIFDEKNHHFSAGKSSLLNRKSSLLNRKSSLLNIKSSFLNRKSSFLNRKSSFLNRKLLILWPPTFTGGSPSPATVYLKFQIIGHFSIENHEFSRGIDRKSWFRSTVSGALLHCRAPVTGNALATTSGVRQNRPESVLCNTCRSLIDQNQWEKQSKNGRETVEKQSKNSWKTHLHSLTPDRQLTRQPFVSILEL